MKLPQLIRFDVAALTLILIAFTKVAHAETVIGPGVVAPFSVNGTTYRIVPGTQIIATASSLSNFGQLMLGGSAVSAVGDKLTIEGGLIQGSTISPPPGVPGGRAGHAVALSAPATLAMEVFGGTLRGGSVLLPEGAFPGLGYRGGSAFHATSQDQIANLTIRGGQFEGGIVAFAATPDVIVSRAPALVLGSEYGKSTDIYGGQFLGGIEFGSENNRPVLRFHGTDFELTPAPINGTYAGSTNVTVAGKYPDGEPFSHSLMLRFHIRPRAIVYERNGALAFEPTNLPEPTGATLAGGFLLLARRRPPRTSGFLA
jgi:hypothetical protein